MYSINSIVISIEKIPLLYCIRRYVSNQFVPKHEPVQEQDIRKMENFLKDKTNVLVLTGAGISTESGKMFNRLQ